ncbi:DUF1786 domain-containing protein [Desulfolutivibrio sulfoxidireducens]|uniref:DUF1786 domain-containing protein n=1 Tax=Desulfolutivibrio sulfoxidireducens TaxID=2773299 RepID=UPI00159D6905|nr:DUF1786 domain-containing protein [Desulfolutivibrio sulfoxidireducens]QLA20230.1 hypothetical protein GD604_11125 [Desulfolutivibrio sulfoxidireducens]
MTQTTLCLDIGSGTQDVLYYDPSLEPENCPKFVLPSPARMVAARIRELTTAGRGVHLFGTNMGGGFFRAVKAHLDAGMAVTATPESAYSLGDDMGRLTSMGVVLAESCPAGHVPVHVADFDPGFWRSFLGAAGLPMPDRVAAAAQDHGFHPGKSNRRGRFTLWETFLSEAGGHPEALVYETPPVMLTRLRALRDSIGGGLTTDTASAAVLGALFDPDVAAACDQAGAVILNMGNSHILGALVFGGRIHGIYEQHQGLRQPEAVWEDLELFRRGELTLDMVFDAGGHGCMTLPLPAEARGFPRTFILGPKRGLLAGRDAVFPCPGGDMMLAGCFGLVKGMEWRREKER